MGRMARRQANYVVFWHFSLHCARLFVNGKAIPRLDEEGSSKEAHIRYTFKPSMIGLLLSLPLAFSSFSLSHFIFLNLALPMASCHDLLDISSFVFFLLSSLFERNKKDGNDS